VLRGGSLLTSVYDLKPRFQSLLRPVCGALARAGITANQVTVTAAVLSAAEGAAIFLTGAASWSLFCLPVVLLVRMALNAIDGILAREFGQASRLGAVLNELGDAVSDVALYLPFAAIPGVSAILISLVVAIGVIAEMARIVAVQIGASRRYEGPLGRSDRALFFGVFAVVLGAGLAPGLWTDIVLGLAALAGAFTIINRVRAALAEVKS